MKYTINMNKELLKYRLFLPRTIEVEIHKAEEGGFWAKIKTFPGCAVQGEDIYDLIEMVNVGIQDYLEIPKKLRKDLERYEPDISSEKVRKIFEDSKHRHIEDIINQIIRNNANMEFSKVPA